MPLRKAKEGQARGLKDIIEETRLEKEAVPRLKGL